MPTITPLTNARPSLFHSALGDLRPRRLGHGRYSIRKARCFDAYVRSTAAVRHVAVVLATPFSGLVASLIVTLVPLQDPVLGAMKNPGVWIQGFFITASAMCSAMIGFRAASSIDHRDYPTRAIVGMAVLAAVPHIAFLFGLALMWRFPVPFSWIVGLGSYSATFTLAHIIVLGKRVVHSDGLRLKLLKCLPAFCVQISQLAIYAGYSALFTAARDWQRIGLVALFPLLKYGLKRAIYTLARGFGDHACESAVAGVEICASMYQTSVMQNAPSPMVTACVIGLDVAMCIVDLVRLVQLKSVLPSNEIVANALALLQDKSQQFRDAGLPSLATRAMPNRVRASPTASIIPSTTVTARRNTTKLALAQALELLQHVETVLLVEYLEVAVPIVNVVHVLVASNQPSAIFDPKIRAFYQHSDALALAIANILLYTVLQAMTLVGVGVALQLRYRLSALTLLAFVLEHHAWALHAKLVCWMPLMFAFSVVHYGVDFTFAFARAG